jgi:hypothetical protein
MTCMTCMILCLEVTFHYQYKRACSITAVLRHMLKTQVFTEWRFWYGAELETVFSLAISQLFGVTIPRRPCR